MYLQIEDDEIQVELRDEFPVQARDGVIERIKVGLVARDREEHRRWQDGLQKAKKSGINSTDGRGNITNRWRVLNTSWRKVEGHNQGFSLLCELEELR